jgi:hypothetical protein
MINQKNPLEFTKETWNLKRKNGEILNSFRGRETALKFKRKYEKIYLEEIILERK